MYSPLHLYSEYSFLESGVHLKELIKKIKNDGYKYLGITDHNNMIAFPYFNKLCLDNEIKPIFGLDLEIEDFKLSLFIENEEGYSSLCKISTLLTQKEINFDNLLDNKEGLIVVLNSDSPIFDNVNKELVNKVALFAKQFDNSDFYIGLNFVRGDLRNHYDLIREFVLKYSYNSIAFPLIKYLERSDSIVIDILENIKNQTHLEQDFVSQNRFNHYKEDDELEFFFTEEELDNVSKLIEKINFNLIQNRGELVDWSTNDKNSEQILKEHILDGLKVKNIDINVNKQYKDRLNHEFITIRNMGYCDYFLIVEDYVKFAKNHNIPVGPGRGSAAGSLIAYLLDITKVDPLKYDLLFERFLNPQRQTMPDIDVDFSDTKREQVVDYLKEKYGKERVARVATIQTIGAKQAIRDVCRVFGVSPNDASLLTKLIVIKNNENVTLSDAYEKYPNFRKEIDGDSTFELVFKYAKLIEGLARQRGLGAAGVVINKDSLIGKIPLFYDSTGYITQYEKDYLEDQNFLKADILGLINLRTIERCLELIKINKNKEVDIENIDYNDPKIYELIEKNLTMGLFQIDTAAAKDALKIFKPKCFDDLVNLISLDRPGPRASIPSFSRRYKGLEKVTYLDPSLKKSLESTYGIFIYQEQIMFASQDFAGFSFSDADLLRRACAKKKKSEMDKMKIKFFNGARKKGHSDKVINDVFELIAKFASYGFNKSHSVAYTMITCEMAYLKAYYPNEFYASILESQSSSNDSKFVNYVSEIKKCKGHLCLPDINLSTTRFDVIDDKLLMPLTSIKNFPVQVVFNILEERDRNGEFKDFIDFVVRMYHLEDSITESQISKLIDAGCFDSLHSNRQSLKQSTLEAIRYAKIVDFREGQLFNFFDAKFNYVECEEDLEERLNNEYEALGITLSDSLLDHVEDKLKELNITKISELENDKEATIAVIFNTVKKINTKNNKTMCFISARDNDNDIEITLFSDAYEKYIDIINFLKKKDIIICKGKLKKNYKNNEYSFILDELRKLNYEKDSNN